MEINRREFLKMLGISSAGLIASGELSAAEASGSGDDGRYQYALLNDGTRCIGCHSCESACREYNELPELPKDEDGNIIYPEELNNTTFTRIEGREIDPEMSPAGQAITYRRHMCNHCLSPSCASACPVGALQKSEEGPVYYRSERCIGCRYCILACPFSIPKYDWDTWKPFVHKCTMCYAKVSEGEPTSCSGACPVGAVKFGYREELVAEAHERIAKEPERYHDYVYGEHDVGGTGVLYLVSKAVPLPEFGFRTDLGSESYPDLTWAALSRVPGLATYVAVWMMLVYFVTHRRMPEEVNDIEHKE